MDVLGSLVEQVHRNLSGRRVLPCILLAASVSLASGLGQPVGAQVQPSETQLKAAFIFNFGQYVEWPEPSVQNPETSKFLLCTLNDPGLNSALQEVLRARTIQGRPVQVSEYSGAQGIGDCDILFISDSHEGRLSEVFSAVQGKGVLTISEIPGFAESGGIIRLFTEDARIRFEINPGAAEKEGLRPSARLLDLARIVGQGSPQGRRPQREEEECGR